MDEQQLAAMRQALKRAFQLGQNYWSWADSEYSSHWKKADAAKAEFDKLVEDTTLTTPPAARRPWVGLDNSERLNIWEKAMIEDNGKNASLQNQPFVHFARAIEAKLKEKNNG
jgi:hypothetical protein